MTITRSRALKAAQEAACATMDRTKTYITVMPSATGQGTHIRWHHPPSVDSDSTMSEAADEINEIPENHPLFSLSPLSSLASLPDCEGELTIDPRFITPDPRQDSDAGSILNAPARKLQRDETRAGFDGVLFWRDGVSGIDEQVVFQPAEGYTMRQALDMQRMDVLYGFRNHLDILIKDKKEAELFFNNNRLSFTTQESLDSQDFVAATAAAGRMGPPCPSEDSMRTDEEDEQTPSFHYIRKNGAILGPQGTHLLGPNGTELFDDQMPSSDDADDMETGSPRRLRRNRVEGANDTSNQTQLTVSTQNQAAGSSMGYPIGMSSGRRGPLLERQVTEMVDLRPYSPPERQSLEFSEQCSTDGSTDESEEWESRIR